MIPKNLDPVTPSPHRAPVLRAPTFEDFRASLSAGIADFAATPGVDLFFASFLQTADRAIVGAGPDCGPCLGVAGRAVAVAGDDCRGGLFVLVLSGTHDLCPVSGAVADDQCMMLIDCDIDFMTAALTSAGAVAANPLAYLVWGGFIAVVTLVSILLGFAGLFITMPVLGHASWHLPAPGPQRRPNEDTVVRGNSASMQMAPRDRGPTQET